MHFFLTGHTGFKGAWLTLLLRELGHQVSGYSLEPLPGSLFEMGHLEDSLENHFIGDVRDMSKLQNSISATSPDAVIHLAAQPLVGNSYDYPLETFEVNVDGTRNLLVALEAIDSNASILIVTTDKVYRDDGLENYIEASPLGGRDPYSSSKAMSDLMTQSWAHTFPQLDLRVARAGNVIGAFDVTKGRLLPDIVEAVASGTPIVLRYPEAVRPWQHVLDCLAGYLQFCLPADSSIEIPKVLNFGPKETDFYSVNQVISMSEQLLSTSLERKFAPIEKAETPVLMLDSSLARAKLNWEPILDIREAIAWSLIAPGKQSALEVATKQVQDYLSRSNLSMKIGRANREQRTQGDSHTEDRA